MDLTKEYNFISGLIWKVIILEISNDFITLYSAE